MNFLISPLKLACSVVATNEKTFMLPLGPFHSFQVAPSRVTVAMALPVDEMGPAPPKAPNQIMISYCSAPVGVEEVKISVETLATMLVPLYLLRRLVSSKQV